VDSPPKKRRSRKSKKNAIMNVNDENITLRDIINCKTIPLEESKEPFSTEKSGLMITDISSS